MPDILLNVFEKSFVFFYNDLLSYANTVIYSTWILASLIKIISDVKITFEPEDSIGN